MRQPEHRFQAWTDRFLDRVVLPPMFTSGIDHAAKDMADVRRRSSLQARGVKPGLPDVVVMQAPSGIAWLELKRGSSVTSAQQGVHDVMGRCGQFVAVCRTMQQVLHALNAMGFRLHENAASLADEYELRVKAGEQAPRTPKAPKAAPRVVYGRRAA